MKVPIPLKIRATLVLQAIAAILQAAVLFPFSEVVRIVNYELYLYGLQFDSVWYRSYQNYQNLFLIGLGLSVILIVLSIVVVLHFIRNNRASLSPAEYIIPLAIVGINIFSIFNFNGITNLVHADLYNYGLHFSFEWATPLTAHTIIILTLMVLTSTAMITTSFLIHFGAREVVTKSVKNKTTTSETQTVELTSFILITAGTAALLTAVFFVSSVLAFIGLGLVFWGILFMYIRKEEYANGIVVNAVACQQMDTMHQIIAELKFQGKPVYLPPEYFTSPETQKVYISKSKETQLPTPKQIQDQESQIFIKEPEGLLLNPLGLELVRLFEKNLATDLTRVDFEYLQLNMPKTLVEDLEIARNLEMVTESNQISVKIEYFADKTGNIEETKKSETQSALKSILSSAIACALAKASGQPIMLMKKKRGKNGEKELVNYRIVTEEAQRQP